LKAIREVGSVVELELDAPDGDGRHGEEPSTRKPFVRGPLGAALRSAL
jgi:hypothetical protein